MWQEQKLRLDMQQSTHTDTDTHGEAVVEKNNRYKFKTHH